MYILDFYTLYVFCNSVFLYRTWYRDSTRVVLPEYGKIPISKSQSNVRILNSTATYIDRAIKMAALEDTVLERLKSSLLLFRRVFPSLTSLPWDSKNRNSFLENAST